MKRAKFILLSVVLIFTFFFSNDFGLIDVEKTSIITAIAIDKEKDEYLVTAQIAVPEATDQNAENRKAEINGKGSTVGEALKNIGDVSGWFPKLAFCNLIIIGDGLKDTNVVKVLDYFAKTLRIQDSALVALAEKQAKELLSLSTPLDNISSFALQKILLKNPGFDRDVCPTDVKSFCSGHYSPSSSAYMPLIKIISSEDGSNEENSNSSSNGGGQNSSTITSGQSSTGNSQGVTENNKNLFDARTTALFVNGVKVGELDPELTVTFNSFKESLTDTTIPVNDVNYNGNKANYLLTVLKGTPKLDIKATNNQLKVNLSLDIYCKISDVNADGSDQTLSENQPLPAPLIEKAQTIFKERLFDLINTSIQTGCDFLKIKEKLYRHHYEQYSRYKDNYLSVMKVSVDAKVHGQK